MLPSYGGQDIRLHFARFADIRSGDDRSPSQHASADGVSRSSVAKGTDAPPTEAMGQADGADGPSPEIRSPAEGHRSPVPGALGPSARRWLDRAAAEVAVLIRPVGAAADAGAEGPAGLLRGGLDRPVGAAVVDVVPDDRADFAVAVADPGEHVLDPGRLRAALVAGGDLGQHHRLVGRDPADDPVIGGVEDLVEALPAGRAAALAPVEAVEAGPVDVF